jgi:3-methyl-2-oxobutanoate hydroxymethyltransferase
LAAFITERLTIPTIGIGAGVGCDGQVLVYHDVLGLYDGHTPKFVRKYAHAAADLQNALTQFLGDVRDGSFPNDAESFHGTSEEELKRLYGQPEESGAVVVEMPKAN